MSHFNWSVDKPVHEIIGEAIGGASMCWEHPERAGEFNSTLANEIAKELEDALRRKLWVEE